jgi:hypothetical protein
MGSGEVLALMWVIYLVASVFILNAFGMIGTIAIFVLSIPLMALSAMIHNTPAKTQITTSSDEADIGKRKRETLDNVLRDLSDEQLETLRQRLQDGTIDDEVLEQRIVGADGEFLSRQQ